QNGDAAGAVPFVYKLLVGRSAELAGASLDRALDRIVGDVVRPRLFDGESQPEVGVDIGSTFPGGDRDQARHLGEDLAASGVLLGLLVLDIIPLRVSRHDGASLRFGLIYLPTLAHVEDRVDLPEF